TTGPLAGPGDTRWPRVKRRPGYPSATCGESSPRRPSGARNSWIEHRHRPTPLPCWYPRSVCRRGNATSRKARDNFLPTATANRLPYPGRVPPRLVTGLRPHRFAVRTEDLEDSPVPRAESRWLDCARERLFCLGAHYRRPPARAAEQHRVCRLRHRGDRRTALDLWSRQKDTACLLDSRYRHPLGGIPRSPSVVPGAYGDTARAVPLPGERPGVAHNLRRRCRAHRDAAMADSGGHLVRLRICADHLVRPVLLDHQLAGAGDRAHARGGRPETGRFGPAARPAIAAQAAFPLQYTQRYRHPGPGEEPPRRRLDDRFLERLPAPDAADARLARDHRLPGTAVRGALPGNRASALRGAAGHHHRCTARSPGRDDSNFNIATATGKCAAACRTRARSRRPPAGLDSKKGLPPDGERGRRRTGVACPEPTTVWCRIGEHGREARRTLRRRRHLVRRPLRYGRLRGWSDNSVSYRTDGALWRCDFSRDDLTMETT